jgi:hypothetical protein
LNINVQIIYCLVNYGVVLLLGVESLTVGSTTGVPMSPGPVYGGYQSSTLQLILIINQCCSSLHHQGFRVLQVALKERKGFSGTTTTSAHNLSPTAFFIV